MSRSQRTHVALAVSVAALLLTGSVVAIYGQATVAPTNDLPNPYKTISNYFQLPAGRVMGATSTVDIDRDGRSIWIAERCGANGGCFENAKIDPVMLFDASGKLVRSFGAGMMEAPHGIHVDRDGNVWVTDYQDNAPTAARGAPADGAGAGRGAGAGAGRGTGVQVPDGAARGGAAAAGAAADGAARQGAGARGAGAAAQGGRGAQQIPRPGATKGHQVFKFSPEGKLLMTIGKPGGAAPPDCCWQPNDVHTAPNGDIFVAEMHGAGGRIRKFDRTGKPITSWGEPGTGPGQFMTPHSLAMDSRGRLFVADRPNHRIQIFDQSGKFLEEWYQFSRISGLYIDANDTLYAADSESSPANHPGWRRGIRIGSARDGKVMYFIPDPDSSLEKAAGTSAAEGVAADAAGNVYGAEVGPRAVKKYVKGS